jgi:hypothetical protein
MIKYQCVFIRPGEQIFRELFSSYWLKILLSTAVMCLLLFQGMLAVKTEKKGKWFTKNHIEIMHHILLA